MPNTNKHYHAGCDIDEFCTDDCPGYDHDDHPDNEHDGAKYYVATIRAFDGLVNLVVNYNLASHYRPVRQLDNLRHAIYDAADDLHNARHDDDGPATSGRVSDGGDDRPA